ncbi:CLUMA_CG016943, isoform A [Clunio marinus]|uniref:CLUMA_CG016943, isoform A n=1 Tax=Clunio marinus TaxID=568069 RepID=A0A1J1IVL1_9DIPT|nr:CLUMA_CG016943, isoform A [Clunio marinus]
MARSQFVVLNMLVLNFSPNTENKTSVLCLTTGNIRLETTSSVEILNHVKAETNLQRLNT